MGRFKETRGIRFEEINLFLIKNCNGTSQPNGIPALIQLSSLMLVDGHFENFANVTSKQKKHALQQATTPT